MTILTAGKSTALAWAEANDEVTACKQALETAKTELERAIRRQDTAAKALSEMVGQNVTTKVFTIGTDAIVVEHERGIRRIRIEQPEK